jgi:proteasome lid subunit RPN8/RPN11
MATKKKFSGPVVKCDDIVLRAIEEHSYTDLIHEVGGMLVGTLSDKGVEITGFVPALKAQGTQVSLTFSHDVWDDILAAVNRDFPGKNIVGWYHTHPGHGLFLSEYDKFIHSNFFPDRNHVAVVVDPVQGNRAWFASDAKNEPSEFRREPTALGPRERVSEVVVASNPKKTQWIVGIVVAALLAGGIGWGLAKLTAPPNSAQLLKVAQQRLEQLEGWQAGIMQSPVFQYTAQAGDTVESVTLNFYGSSKYVALVESLNGLKPDATLKAGQVLALAFLPDLKLTGEIGSQSFPDLDPSRPTPTPTPPPSPSTEVTPKPTATTVPTV